MLSANRGMSRFGKEPPAPAGGAPLCGQCLIDIQRRNYYSSTMKRKGLIKHLLLKDTDVTIRPIRAEDSGMEQEFVQHLSKESRYFRFMASIWELSPKKLKYFTEIDYNRHMAFVATIMRDHKEVEIGVARYVHTEIPGSCEFGITVDDAWHGSGVAVMLMISLEETARECGFKTMEGIVLPRNEKMLRLAQKRGFEIYFVPGEEETVHIRLQL
ncbi:MAG: GNAT family N-acetyltransferase [Deltaproteobacteria bacterium]|nr:GNAT family N-acetyltransferase [Deltaproteobacteria bacterium]